MLVIGLTGGIASGKTTISKYLAERGAKIIDADIIAREVVEPGEKAWHQILAYFGPEVIKEDQTLDRAKLGQIIFHHPEKRERLNEIIHPQVIKRTEELVELYKNDSTIPLIVIDAPLLIEAKMTDLVDEVWVIDVTEENQIKRVMERDNLCLEGVKKRIASQMATQDKLKFAHRVINTNVSPRETLLQLEDLWKEVVKKGYDSLT